MLMLPAPAQGALAVECRADDADLVELLGRARPRSRPAPRSPRSGRCWPTLEAGCSAPVAACAEVAEGDDGDEIYLRGAVFSPDGARAIRLSRTGTPADAAEIGRRSPPTCSTTAPTDPGDSGSTQQWERSMTRTRKPAGRIAFVGAGPGDPGLLTRRAHDALVDADQVVYDRGVPESLLDRDPRRGRRTTPQFSPAEGAPGDVAKVLLSAARSGLRAVHLVAGDPFGHDAVVKEVQAVARTAVPSRWCPASARPTGVATYAGVPLPGVRTTADVDDVAALDFEALAAAAAPGSLALAVDAGDLAAVRDGLLAAGRRRRHRRSR